MNVPASMADFLDSLLPRFFPGLAFQCIPHDGKQDLEKSIPRKLRAWREPGVRFVVVRDQDSADCHQVKDELSQLCRKAGRCDVLVRVVCRELEAWYIGEPEAVLRAFPDAPKAHRLSRSRYRDPDQVVHPADVMSRLIPEFQKRRGARRMACFLSHDNRSRSFQVFVEGVRRLQQTFIRTGTC